LPDLWIFVIWCLLIQYALLGCLDFIRYRQSWKERKKAGAMKNFQGSNIVID
jgi:hypothetical protein